MTFFYKIVVISNHGQMVWFGSAVEARKGWLEAGRVECNVDARQLSASRAHAFTHAQDKHRDNFLVCRSHSAIMCAFQTPTTDV